jgi:exopolyphosphatase/guanosine-5'-triphosphate,3'-diphosphate pyrophosphatase
LACLERFGQRLRGVSAHHVRALGTNTLRRTRNPRSFLRAAEHALQHPIEIISGHEEARLIYLGVAHSLGTEPHRRLVIDIGGGSTELVVGEGYRPLEMDSLSVGCVGISEQFFPDGVVTRAAFKAAQTAVALEIRPLRAIYKQTGWEEVIGSSGTIRAAARIIEASGWSTGGITPSGLKRLRRALESAGKMSRADLPGLSAERRPVLPGGIAILSACLRNLEIEQLSVSEYALREGALSDLVGRVRHQDPRETSIHAIAARYGVDPDQAQRVCQTALQSFDRVSAAWGLSDADRQRLEWAARLHEVGLAIAHDQYHKHGAYLVEHTDLNGFSRDEQLTLAALILAHRKKITADVFAQLPERLVPAVTRITVILRLAVLLHRSRLRGEIPSIDLQVDGTEVAVQFPPEWLQNHPLTQADLEGERDALRRIDVHLTFT